MLTRKEALGLPVIRLEQEERIPSPITDIYILRLDQSAESRHIDVEDTAFDRIDLIVNHGSLLHDSFKRYNGECDFLNFSANIAGKHSDATSWQVFFDGDRPPCVGFLIHKVEIYPAGPAWAINYEEDPENEVFIVTGEEPVTKETRRLRAIIKKRELALKGILDALTTSKHGGEDVPYSLDLAIRKNLKSIGNFSEIKEG